MAEYARGKCYRCNGRGRFGSGECWKCRGTGYIVVPVSTSDTPGKRMLRELHSAGIQVQTFQGGVAIQGYEVAQSEFEALAEASASVNDFLERLAVMRRHFE